MPSTLQLREKLVADGAELVVLESTNDYWRPLFYVLSEQLEVMLVVKASDVRTMSGVRATSPDAEWLADLPAPGLVRPSFVPPEDIRQLRDLTQSRTVLVAKRTRRA